ncbi:MAG: ABC transporter ATP-binding protein [Proteobacteria bacterium]|nr:ABC transporter ATP-binding protein [Pseudomonadota bacterium]
MLKNRSELVLPIVVFAMFIVFWELLTRFGDIHEAVLPPPSAVAQALLEHSNELLSAGLASLLIAGTGFSLSLIVGIFIAIVMSQSKAIEASLYPYALFLQCVPVVAIAPLFILWFGYGLPAMIMISFVLALFPIITTTINGIQSVSKEHLELMQLCEASQWQVLTKVRLPSAVPYIITGARVSAGLSVVGAIVGEYFAGLAGRAQGLAYLIRSNEQNADFPYLFATTIACAVLGLIIFLFVGFIGDKIREKGHFQEKR